MEPALAQVLTRQAERRALLALEEPSVYVLEEQRIRVCLAATVCMFLVFIFYVMFAMAPGDAYYSALRGN